jgi:DNA uptake protein ComE-like DNA-binding protein
MKHRILPLLLLFLSCCGSAMAWSYHTHRKLTADAVRLMPETFRNEFAGQKANFLKGSTDPDTLIKDFTNHVYHPDGSMVDGLYRIQNIFQSTVELIKTNAGPEKISYMLGLMSHYIADLNQPLHTAGSERDNKESEYHIKYERDINPHLKNLELPQITYRPVTDIEHRVKEMTGVANRYYDSIGRAYRNGNGLQELMEISERQMAAATANIVDFWLGAFLAAGRNLGGIAPSAASTRNDPDWNTEETTTKNTSEQININTATAAQLASFFNIEVVKAQRIVAARPFSSAYDLAKVQGFTVHFVKRHRERIKLK